MRKNIYLYGLLIVVCLFNLLKSIGQPNQTEFDNYITISNGRFKDGNAYFIPFVSIIWLSIRAINLHFQIQFITFRLCLVTAIS